MTEAHDGLHIKDFVRVIPKKSGWAVIGAKRMTEFATFATEAQARIYVEGLAVGLLWPRQAMKGMDNE